MMKWLIRRPYSFSSRFEEGVGTNPEELIAAAPAATRWPSAAVGLAGFPGQHQNRRQSPCQQAEGGFIINRSIDYRSVRAGHRGCQIPETLP
jgi:hypothetical protein